MHSTTLVTWGLPIELWGHIAEYACNMSEFAMIAQTACGWRTDVPRFYMASCRLVLHHVDRITIENAIEINSFISATTTHDDNTPVHCNKLARFHWHDYPERTMNMMPHLQHICSAAPNARHMIIRDSDVLFYSTEPTQYPTFTQLHTLDVGKIDATFTMNLSTICPNLTALTLHAIPYYDVHLPPTLQFLSMYGLGVLIDFQIDIITRMLRDSHLPALRTLYYSHIHEPSEFRAMVSEWQSWWHDIEELHLSERTCRNFQLRDWPQHMKRIVFHMHTYPRASMLQNLPRDCMLVGVYDPLKFGITRVYSDRPRRAWLDCYDLAFPMLQLHEYGPFIRSTYEKVFQHSATQYDFAVEHQTLHAIIQAWDGDRPHRMESWPRLNLDAMSEIKSRYAPSEHQQCAFDYLVMDLQYRVYWKYTTQRAIAHWVKNVAIDKKRLRAVYYE